MKIRGIYQILNKRNGKRYIGSSENAKRRLYVHQHLLSNGKHHSVALQSAWARYGAAAFEFSIIAEVQQDVSLIEAEQLAIDRLGSFGRGGYNMCPTAGSRLGSVQPESMKIALSVARKGRPKSEETKAKMSAAALARPPKSEEHRRRIAESVTRLMSDPARRAHLSVMNTGRKMSEEAKRKISVALKGRPVAPEIWQAGVAAAAKRVISNDERARLSERARNRVFSQATRAKMSLAHKGNQNAKGWFHSEEWRRNHSEKLRANWARRKAAKIANG